MERCNIGQGRAGQGRAGQGRAGRAGREGRVRAQISDALLSHACCSSQMSTRYCHKHFQMTAFPHGHIGCSKLHKHWREHLKILLAEEVACLMVA